MPNRPYLWSEGRDNRFLDVTQEHGTKQQHKLLASVKTALPRLRLTRPALAGQKVMTILAS